MSSIIQPKEYRPRFTLANKLCLGYLALVVFCALFADWLPLHYQPNEQDLWHIYQEPFKWEMYQAGNPFHYLGTDDLGRDVGVNLIYGARTALLVSVPTIMLAATLGIVLGLLAGYYRDSGLKLPVGNLISLFVAVFCACFYFPKAEIIFKESASFGLTWLVRVGILGLSYLIYKLIKYLLLRISLCKQLVNLPVDLVVLKLIELIGAVPRLLLILSLAAFAPNASVINVILLSVVTFWPGIARLTRGEIIKVKNLPYIEAAVALGFHPARIITRHVLPNILVPLLVAITFGICNLISLEATLSFLGIGIPDSMPSWGRSINKIRENFQAWWLVLFPGLAILLTVLSLQNINNLIIRRWQTRVAE